MEDGITVGHLDASSGERFRRLRHDLGVTSFGQSGDLDSVYRHHGLDVDSIAAAALDLVD